MPYAQQPRAPKEVGTVLARPGLPSFDYVRARTPTEVIRLLQKHGDTARLLMGGTDLFVRMRDGVIRPRLVVDVKHLPGMRDVAYDPRVGLTIGAAVTMNEIVRHPAVLAHCPLLAEAAASVASYQLRNRATIGGNLCNGSPAADTAPAALVLEGRLLISGPEGERILAAESFFLGPGRTALRPGEFLRAIRFPPPPPRSAGRYLKLGRNKTGDLSIVGAAVFAFADDTAPAGCRFRIALASVAPTPLRVRAAEDALAVASLLDEGVAQAARLAMEAAAPIDDVRASAVYRREMVGVLTRRGLRQVWEALQGV